MDYFTSESYLNVLDGSKYQCTKGHIKVIKFDDVTKSASRFELMCFLIGLHRTPIIGKTVVTDKTQFVKRLLLILNKQSSLLQNLNLIWQIHR